MSLATLLLVLVVLSWIYWAVALWCVRDFFCRDAPPPDADFAPPVSILKPVRGLDPGAYENFASFCSQQYPRYEILFGVADRNDPAVAVIERLQRNFPERTIRLVVGAAPGANRKAGVLHRLAAEARHDLLVISDSDMRVTPDYLRQVVAPLADPQIGLVTCPYRGAQPLTLAAQLEALYIGAAFIPSVMVGRHFLEMRFAMGATIALRRPDLTRIGGFAAFANHLADDYEAAVRIAGLGRRVRLSHYIVDSVLGATIFAEQWHREGRWARCVRVSRPLEYPGVFITFSTPLALTTALVMDFNPQGWAVLIITLLWRWLFAWLVSGYTHDRAVRRWLFWLPARDVLTLLIWIAAGIGRRVVWRGEEFHLLHDGRMQVMSHHRVFPFVGLDQLESLSRWVREKW